MLSEMNFNCGAQCRATSQVLARDTLSSEHDTGDQVLELSPFRHNQLLVIDHIHFRGTAAAISSQQRPRCRDVQLRARGSGHQLSITITDV